MLRLSLFGGTITITKQLGPIEEENIQGNPDFDPGNYF